MQRNFILTDLMKTGKHEEVNQFISSHSLQDQSFDLECEYYRLHNYDIDSYDRRFAIIDMRHDNNRLKDNTEFSREFERRCELLHSQGFKFIAATPWESYENISQTTLYPDLKIDHIKWTGGVSWFWSHMYHKHKHKKYNFEHKEKTYDFLYLNKTSRRHRVKMFDIGLIRNCQRITNYHGLKIILCMVWIKTYMKSHIMTLLVVLCPKPMTTIQTFL